MTEHQAPTLQTVPKLNSHFRLQFEQAQNAWVLLYPEGMIRLNQSGGEIIKRCNGTDSIGTIVADLEQTFSAKGLANDVLGFIDGARRQNWVSY